MWQVGDCLGCPGARVGAANGQGFNMRPVVRMRSIVNAHSHQSTVDSPIEQSKCPVAFPRVSIQPATQVALSNDANSELCSDHDDILLRSHSRQPTSHNNIPTAWPPLFQQNTNVSRRNAGTLQRDPSQRTHGWWPRWTKRRWSWIMGDIVYIYASVRPELVSQLGLVHLGIVSLKCFGDSVHRAGSMARESMGNGEAAPLSGGKVWVVGGNSYGVLGGLGVERILAGGVLLAMRNTGFSIVFSPTPWGGIPNGEVCWLGCGLEVFGFCDAWWCFGGLFWGLFMAGVWAEESAMGRSTAGWFAAADICNSYLASSTSTVSGGHRSVGAICTVKFTHLQPHVTASLAPPDRSPSSTSPFDQPSSPPRRNPLQTYFPPWKMQSPNSNVLRTASVTGKQMKTRSWKSNRGIGVGGCQQCRARASHS
ncbi:hypothetical protein PCH_Pc16g03400 [Penicillium rubens Wisconsin 54-1255]|uniref:Uncharacterized protein n=1 Tax=Penicillium rubens (strain ATCC 28089 / DSM 1075 / NRRL 1951 / Wisconsin 54-1255) TaxID=500485 RepID=B6H940_PENRW|nr:hypothetical protein PCH_Pc16g03400 [Penicillium rubens Wisconsin 54-1255]